MKLIAIQILSREHREERGKPEAFSLDDRFPAGDLRYFSDLVFELGYRFLGQCQFFLEIDDLDSYLISSFGYRFERRFLLCLD